MKKSSTIISLLLTTSCYIHAQCMSMQPEKAFTELTKVRFFTKKDLRATMLKKLALRTLKAVEGHINDVVTITTKYANSYHTATPKETYAKEDNAGRPKTVAQTQEFITFINKLKRLSKNIKDSIYKTIKPFLEKKLTITDVAQLDDASLYIRQRFDARQKTSLSQLELSLPQLANADTLDMQLIQQYVDTAINYFLQGTISDHYNSIIDALKKLKVPIDLPHQLTLDTLKHYYDLSTTKAERIKIKPEQVKQKLKKYKTEE